MLTAIFLTDRHDQVFLKALHAVDFADEVLIFDYQSQNNWSKLKKKFPQIRVVKKGGKINDFAAVRNEAIEMVKTDWLLFLDSDEVLENGAKEKILNLMKGETAAYYLKRVDFFHDQKMNWGEVKNVYLPRLAQTKKIKYQRKVHEEAIIDGKIKKSDLVIRHYAHQSVEEFLTSVNNYAELEASYRHQKNWSYSKLRIFGEALLFPPLKFFHNYFLKLGLLDGFTGLVYALLMSCHSLLVRIYLYEKYFST